ncbi:MAG: hypothetical protein KJO78_05380 [Alphaproteobacteria bacterium]|nr:hypothetical protein [Alphaproteobacteria bacterium]
MKVFSFVSDFVARIIGLQSLLLALAFFIVGYDSLERGNPSGVVVLIAAFLNAAMGLAFLVPKYCLGFLHWSYRWWRRLLVAPILLAWIALLFLGTALLMIGSDRSGILSSELSFAILALGALVCFMAFLCFVLPGFGYARFRPRLMGQEPSNAAQIAEMVTMVPYTRMAPVRIEENSLIRFVVGIPFLLLLGMWFYAFAMAQVIPMPSTIVTVVQNELLLIVVFGVLVSVSFLLGTHLDPNRKTTGLRLFVGRVFFATVAFAFAGVMTHLVAVKALPRVHALVSETQPTAHEMVVVERGRESSRRRCNRIAYAVWPQLPNYQIALCNVPRPVWERLEPGSQITVVGQATNHALIYGDVRLK